MLRRDILWIQSTARPNPRLFNELNDLCDLEKVSESAEAFYRLRFDEPPVDAIVIDVDCEDDALVKRTVEMLPRIREIDPDIPIYVLIEADSSELSYAAGQVGAKLRMRPHILSFPNPAKTFLEEIKKALRSHPSYDLKQRNLANEVAGQYI